ncbi:MAG: hypothetical protein GY701_07375, partial [Sulfitobacter sp.]|nr:hypothetical protein [Sulfitobacter sp.]
DKTPLNLLLHNPGPTSTDPPNFILSSAAPCTTRFLTGYTSDTTGNAISVANTAPTLTNLNGDNVTFILGSSGTYLDATDDATVTDTTSVNFDGGNVTASIVTNAQAGEDMLSIDNVGSITTSGSNVNHSGVTMGSFTGGSGGVNLVITLNVDATVARVQDLVRALQYTDTDGATANTLARSVRVTVNDGDGGSGTSSNQDITVNLVQAPVIDLDGNDSTGATDGGYNGSFTENGGAVALAD